MLNYNPLQNLPSSDELPDSDDTPVDNELQNLIPALYRCDREWLYWYDEQGNRFPSIEEIAAEERLRAKQERLRAERLAEQLRAMGINPDEL